MLIELNISPLYFGHKVERFGERGRSENLLRVIHRPGSREIFAQMPRQTGANVGRPGARRTVCRGGLAGEPGFEPRLTESESAVLPLNYPPTEVSEDPVGRNGRPAPLIGDALHHPAATRSGVLLGAAPALGKHELAAAHDLRNL